MSNETIQNMHRILELQKSLNGRRGHLETLDSLKGIWARRDGVPILGVNTEALAEGGLCIPRLPEEIVVVPCSSVGLEGLSYCVDQRVRVLG